LNIHPDFQAIKGVATTIKRLPLALMNGFLSTVNSLYLKRYKTIVSHETIPGLDGHRVPLLIFTPEDLATPSPALVYYHGGAFILKQAPPHLDNAARYAREANCRVIFVDYRLAPQCPFPAAFNDCYSALQWTLTNSQKLNVDKERIAVGGDSAGGALAAGVAQRALHDGIKLCGQMLVYPIADSTCHWPSVKKYSSVPPFKALPYIALWEAYLGQSLSVGIPTYAAPLLGDVSGVAPAYVETAQYDPLHNEGMAYAEALQAKGIEVDVNATTGTVHGFDLLAAKSSISKAAMASRIQFLRKVFQG
jgi:acetyl esterase/lipase